jgi:hypothetical protein
LISVELAELITRAVRVVDSDQSVHPAVHILAHDQIRRVRFGILDADRLVAGLLDRLFQFRCAGHRHLRVPIEGSETGRVAFGDHSPRLQPIRICAGEPVRAFPSATRRPKLMSMDEAFAS